VRGCGLVSSGSIQCTVAVPCGHGNEHSNSVKGEKFLDQLSDYNPLKKILLHAVN
jgi:hypothetical protein